MLMGIHAPTSGATAEFNRTADALSAAVLLFFSPHQVSDAERFPNATILYRTLNPHPDETPDAWLARAGAAIDPWVQHYGTSGQLLLQGGCEPELKGYDLLTPWNLDAWLAAAHGYRDALAARYPGTPLLAPPLSVGNTPHLTADYLSGYAAAAIHSYFAVGNPGWRQGRDGGASWRVATDLGTPCYVTEMNSNPTSVDEIVAWAREVDNPLVLGCTLFIADSAASWPQYTVTPDQAAAIRTALATPTPAPIPTPPPPTPPEPPMPTTDLAALRAAIASVADVPHMGDAMWMGAALETSLQNVAQYGGGPGRGYFQIESGPGGSHMGQLSEADAFDPVKACEFMAGDYRAAVGTVTDYTSDPAGALATVAFHAERPAVMYPRDRIDAAYALIAPYLSATPPGTPTTRVSGAQVVAAAMKYHGASHFVDEGVDKPSYYLCEEFTEVCQEDCGLPRVRYPTANAAADSAPLTAGHAPAGALVFWRGTGWSVYGHVGISLGNGQTISALSVVTISDGWQDAAGYLGYRWPEQVGPDAPPAQPVSTAPTMDWGQVALMWSSLGAPWTPQYAIFTSWLADRRKGVNHGIPTGPEQAFENGARSLQCFSVGEVAQYLRGDGSVTWLSALPDGDPPAA